MSRFLKNLVLVCAVIYLYTVEKGVSDLFGFILLYLLICLLCTLDFSFNFESFFKRRIFRLLERYNLVKYIYSPTMFTDWLRLNLE
jgi:hypothetical protein